jgi:hypothetical protein
MNLKLKSTQNKKQNLERKIHDFSPIRQNHLQIIVMFKKFQKFIQAFILDFSEKKKLKKDEFLKGNSKKKSKSKVKNFRVRTWSHNFQRYFFKFLNIISNSIQIRNG